jgi:hypothetical protein
MSRQPEVFIPRDLYGLSRDEWQHLTANTFTFGIGDTKAEPRKIIRRSRFQAVPSLAERCSRNGVPRARLVRTGWRLADPLGPPERATLCLRSCGRSHRRDADGSDRDDRAPRFRSNRSGSGRLRCA